MARESKEGGRGKNQIKLKALRRAQRQIKQEMAEKTIPNCGLEINKKIIKNLAYLRVDIEIKQKDDIRKNDQAITAAELEKYKIETKFEIDSNQDLEKITNDMKNEIPRMLENLQK